MIKAAPFPEWLPDLANNTLARAVNTRAIANGYAPVKAFQAVTAALGEAFNGGGAFLDSASGSTLLAATVSAVYKYTGSAWSSVSATPSSQVNRFAQFGDNVLWANGSTAKSYALLTGVVTTPTDAPNLIDIAPVRDFVMGITTDNAAQWCQFNNSAVWTTGTSQADKQPSLWGKMRRIVGGEYALILTDSAVVRVSYVGAENDIIFQFDEIASEVGCMAAGSVCNVGRMVGFLSERGFEICDGQTVTPIGDEKFNRWFFDKFSRQEIDNIWAAVDPRHSLMLWGMPSLQGTVIAYNWVLNRATVIELDLTGMMTGFTASINLDGVDAVYGNLDAVPISLDDPSLSGGNPVLLIADSSNVLGALSGDNMAAIFRLDNIEPTPGRRSRIRSLRLISDALEASATVDARMHAGDSEGSVTASTMRGNGKLPIRSNGRYNTLEVTIPEGADWSYVQGCEIEFEAGDGR